MELEVHLNFIIKISDYNFMRVDFFIQIKFPGIFLFFFLQKSCAAMHIMVFQLHNWAEKSGEARKIIAGKM